MHNGQHNENQDTDWLCLVICTENHQLKIENNNNERLTPEWELVLSELHFYITTLIILKICQRSELYPSEDSYIIFKFDCTNYLFFFLEYRNMSAYKTFIYTVHIYCVHIYRLHIYCYVYLLYIYDVYAFTVYIYTAYIYTTYTYTLYIYIVYIYIYCVHILLMHWHN